MRDAPFRLSTQMRRPSKLAGWMPSSLRAENGVQNCNRKENFGARQPMEVVVSGRAGWGPVLRPEPETKPRAARVRDGDTSGERRALWARVRDRRLHASDPDRWIVGLLPTGITQGQPIHSSVRPKWFCESWPSGHSRRPARPLSPLSFRAFLVDEVQPHRLDVSHGRWGCFLRICFAGGMWECRNGNMLRGEGNANCQAIPRCRGMNSAKGRLSPILHSLSCSRWFESSATAPAW